MQNPEMVPVDSSNVASIGFDTTSDALHVEFVGGRIYVYSPVPESTFEELMRADSKGSYINREIKPNFDCHEL